MTESCWCGGKINADLECVESPRFHDPLATGRPTVVNRLYIAGPMSNLPECNYPLFNRVADKLRGAGLSVVNPADRHVAGKHHYVDLLREDLRLMLNCNGVATLDNWWESVGARNEVQVAGVLKMPVRPWQDWMPLNARKEI